MSKKPEWGLFISCGNATSTRSDTEPRVGAQYNCGFSAHGKQSTPCVITRVKAPNERIVMPPIY